MRNILGCKRFKCLSGCLQGLVNARFEGESVAVYPQYALAHRHTGGNEHILGVGVGTCSQCEGSYELLRKGLSLSHKGYG